LLTALLYGVSVTDPLTFAGVAVLMIIVALLACLCAGTQRDKRGSDDCAATRVGGARTRPLHVNNSIVTLQ